jgi:hypothetical protein
MVEVPGFEPGHSTLAGLPGNPIPRSELSGFCLEHFAKTPAGEKINNVDNKRLS